MKYKGLYSGFFIGLGIFVSTVAYAVEKTHDPVRNPFVLSGPSGTSVLGSIDDYPINSLTLVGILLQANEKIARVRDPGRRDYWLRVGEIIGSERATVWQISADSVQLKWQLNDQVMIAVLNIDAESYR